ncbi:hypothetical protein MASR2M47_29630 [Draconibacterium sp.]
MLLKNTIQDVAKAHLNNNLNYPSAKADGNKVANNLTMTFPIAVHFSERVDKLQMTKGF